MGNGWNTPGESLTDLVPAPPKPRTFRQYDPALTALISVVTIVAMACAPAVIIGVWRWAF